MVPSCQLCASGVGETRQRRNVQLRLLGQSARPTKERRGTAMSAEHGVEDLFIWTAGKDRSLLAGRAARTRVICAGAAVWLTALAGGMSLLLSLTIFRGAYHPLYL